MMPPLLVGLSAIVLSGGLASAPAPVGSVTLIDDTATLMVDVPAAWTDIDTSPGTNDDGTVMPWISASTDFAAYRVSFDVPGMAYIQVSFTTDLEQWIDRLGQPDGCATQAVEPYDDGAFTGLRATFGRCGPSGEATFVLVAANLATPVEPARTYVVQAQAPTPADMATIDTVLGSFHVVGVTSTESIEPAVPSATLPSGTTAVAPITLPDGSVLAPVLVPAPPAPFRHPARSPEHPCRGVDGGARVGGHRRSQLR